MSEPLRPFEAIDQQIRALLKPAPDAMVVVATVDADGMVLHIGLPDPVRLIHLGRDLVRQGVEALEEGDEDEVELDLLDGAKQALECLDDVMDDDDV